MSPPPPCPAPAPRISRRTPLTPSVHKEDLPAVVVIDTEVNGYYDMTIEGARATLDGADVFSVLEGIFMKFLSPNELQSTFSWLGATNVVVGAAVSRPRAPLPRAAPARRR